MQISKGILNHRFLLSIAYKAAPLYTIHKLISKSRMNILNILEQIYFLGYLIDAVSERVSFSEILIHVGSIFLLCMILGDGLSLYVENRIEPIARQSIDFALRDMLRKKAVKMDVSCYDDPEFYNDFIWSMKDATGRTHAVLDDCAVLIGSITGICILGGIFVNYEKMGLLFTVASFLGVYVVSGMMNRLILRRDFDINADRRKASYVERVFYLKDYVKEIRLNHMKDSLIADYGEAMEQVLKKTKKYHRCLPFLGFVNRFLFGNFLFAVLYLLYLLYQTMVRHAFGYGIMIMLYRSCSNLRGTLNTFSTLLPKMKQNSLYIDKIRMFLGCPEKIVSRENALPMSRDRDVQLSLRNVTFSYREQRVLNNITFDMNQGEQIAIVGYNGAGKSTLIKLLMRFYDPVSGAIFYQGNNIKEYELQAYRELFDTLFQDSQVFAFSMENNIAMGDQGMDSKKMNCAFAESGFEQVMANKKNK